ncbi:MAG: ABC transporter ATP-binding protein [Deltaproteobacteria bacterium]|jgi:ABC-type multidrug transport system ATPase subunit|nr:ABC transporter ATP-binding protein [Deltaproteobacteria bacterium]
MKVNALYSLSAVTRCFGEREVLHVDELDIEAGEIYALLGPNGAGKSTLMRILAFLDTPSRGELFFRGQKVQAGQEERYRPGVVWVPQFPVMFTGSLLYNVAYPLILKKIERLERKRKAMELLDLLKLSHLALSPAHKLSGGEAQRASIARALAAGAEIILFDEPTANVDQKSLGDFVAIVRDIWDSQKLSILISTHNASLAATLCRRQIFLCEGKVVQQHLLQGGAAWPARISENNGSFCVHIAHAALSLQISKGQPAIIRGLTSLAAGISLRLEIAPGHAFDFLLTDASSKQLAQSLTLGSSLAIYTS